MLKEKGCGDKQDVSDNKHIHENRKAHNTGRRLMLSSTTEIKTPDSYQSSNPVNV